LIKIDLSRPQLDNDILEAVPGWPQKAAELTAGNMAARRHTGSKDGDIWSDIKHVLVDAQLGKCAYCERVFSSSAVEIDVDHYRPKRRVLPWKSREFEFHDKPDPGREGYYLLAYDPGNYLAACATCNRTYKRSYFPVRGDRQTDSSQAGELALEEPLLINPMDADDPENLIAFAGLVPRACLDTGRDQLRARATIELFNLARRDELLRERAELIVNLWLAYQVRLASGSLGRNARKIIAAARESGSEHANCARSFLRLCESDEREAERVHDEVQPLWESYRKRRHRHRRRRG
jgi:hypothetical protein